MLKKRRRMCPLELALMQKRSAISCQLKNAESKQCGVIAAFILELTSWDKKIQAWGPIMQESVFCQSHKNVMVSNGY